MDYYTEQDDNIMNVKLVITGITLDIGFVERITHDQFLAYSYNNQPVPNGDGFVFSTYIDARTAIAEAFRNEYGLNSI